VCVDFGVQRGQTKAVFAPAFIFCHLTNEYLEKMSTWKKNKGIYFLGKRPLLGKKTFLNILAFIIGTSQSFELYFQ
jgi:hypothetical protein